MGMSISTEIDSDTPLTPAQSLGYCAARIINQRVHGKVIGLTSRGVFLAVEPDQILFLSGEIYQGPLTINLAQRLDFRKHFNLGDTCDLSPEQLSFQKCRIKIPKGTRIWRLAPIVFTKDTWSAVLKRGRRLAADLVTATQDGLFLPFLKAVCRRTEDGNPYHPPGESDLWAYLPGLYEGQPRDFTQHLLGLIGRGGGLTPSGDDFLVGFLLASHTLAVPNIKSETLNMLQTQILESAQRKTTTLSANLMQCAAEGLADARVMNGLQWLAQGGMSLAQVKSDLLSYGSSSGVDSFAGMLAAILRVVSR
jgi:hypothetical protein